MGILKQGEFVLIQNKRDLQDFLKADKMQLGIARKFPRPLTDDIWKYEINLRKYEYWLNSKSVISRLVVIYYKMKHHRMGIRLGIEISPNVVGKGLSIAHGGCVEINDQAKVGDNLRIQEGVNIGASGGNAPVIQDNVFLASGCKVMGSVVVKSGCVVGANAVLVRTVDQDNCTIAGIPAKKISENNSERFVYWYKNHN